MDGICGTSSWSAPRQPDRENACRGDWTGFEVRLHTLAVVVGVFDDLRRNPEAVCEGDLGQAIAVVPVVFGDFAGCDVGFQVSQILDGDAVGVAVIDRMIGTAVNMMETYLPAFMSVVYGNEEPVDAIRRVEAGFCGQTRG
jgi:hypothetical protein